MIVNDRIDVIEISIYVLVLISTDYNIRPIIFSLCCSDMHLACDFNLI